MAEIRDFFIKTLDEAECGINQLMNRLCDQLKNNDHKVFTRLKQQELYPQYYSFRYEDFSLLGYDVISSSEVGYLIIPSSFKRPITPTI